jgi:hypothetical protein
MATALFIKSVDLKRNSIIDGNVDEDKFMSFIKIAQEFHIQNYLGTKLYQRLQAGIIADDLTADEITLLDDYIQDALIHFAIAEYLPFAAFQVKNGGVFRHNSENSSPVDKSEIDYLASKERSFAEYYIKRLVDYLCEYNSLYPLYTSNEKNDIRPDKTLNRASSWRSSGYSSNGNEYWMIDE